MAIDNILFFHYDDPIDWVGKFPEICQSIENRITYILETGIPDFLSRNMRDNRLPQTWPCGVTGSLRLMYIPILKGILIVYVPVKSKLQHPPPPGQPPGICIFCKIFVQIPPSRGRKAVQMPHHRSIPGDQMPPPPGNFSVAFIMFRKLRM